MNNLGAELSPRLIAGMPRAGSTWLMRALNCHPDVAAFGETCFWGRGFVQPSGDGNYYRVHLDLVASVLKTASFDTVVGRNEAGWLQNITEQALADVIDSTLNSLAPPVKPGDVFTALGDAIAAAEGKKLWVEKTPHHVIWTDRILRWLPQTRFVITLRDPFEFMLSYKHTRGMTSEDARTLEALYHPVACAIVYRTYARVAMRLARRLPDQVLLMHLHQIKNNPTMVMDRILRFFGCLPFPRDVALPRPAYSSFDDCERPELLPAERFWAATIAGPSARSLGYRVDRPSIWGSKIYKPIITFPLWAFRTLRLMSRRVEGGVLVYLWRWLFPRRS
jgi:hypothetical protein